MSVLDREELEQSPLADLHAIASELSLDGYRRLRKGDLIEAILSKQGGDEAGASEEAADETAADEPEEAGEAKAAAEGIEVEDADESDADSADGADGADDADESDAEERPAARRRRGRRGGRGRASSRESGPRQDEGATDGEAAESSESAGRPAPAEAEAQADDETIEGEVDLLPNGSAFVRVNPPEPSDEDVYISAAQVKRCELVSGDRISGPRRAPRRSERFASLIRIDAINGRPASEMAEGARYDDLPCAFPNERFKLGSEDPTVKAIEWLTPFGKGSRVTIVGGARAGKTEALRRLAAALAEHEELQLFVALAGVRPEEIGEWNGGSAAPTTGASFAASADAQGHSIELVLDRARRVAARGGDAVVLIDSLDGLHSSTPGASLAARKATAAARNLVDGGSLTVIATAAMPVGGETTVIALDARLAATGRFPALDIVASGVMRPELLVGDAGAAAIARARAAAEDE